ncbi:MAG: hypothetical protein U0Y10_13835 [Spirosomataceae bacterium]
MNSLKYLAGAMSIALSAVLLSCDKNTENVSPSESVSTSAARATDASAAAAPAYASACEDYSLALSGSYTTPIPGLLTSEIHRVQLCTGVENPISTINIGGVPVYSVTGISKMDGNTKVLYAVTGKNSNYPYKLLKVEILTGNATVIATTTTGIGATPIPLQDIDNYGANYFAIREGTNQVVSINVGTGVCTTFAVAPTNYPLTGLTFKGNRMWVIAGVANFNCSPNYGDMFEYTLGGVLNSSNSYNAGVMSYTNKELGLDFFSSAACCTRNWVVASASTAAGGSLTYNLNLCSGGGAPTLLGGVKPTYDFAKR